MELHKLDAGIWVLEGSPVSFFSFPYQIRSTIIDLGHGALLVHSPVQLGAARLMSDLPGQVKYLVSPNKLHSLFLDEWIQAFPEAKLYAAPGLKARFPSMPVYKTLSDEPEEAWRTTLKQKLVRGSWFMSEAVFFHKPSRTLILGDLIENHDPDKLGRLHRLLARANAIVAPAGTTARIFRWTFFRRKRVRDDLAEIRGWNAKRVVVNHGPIVETGAADFLRNAFKWAL